MKSKALFATLILNGWLLVSPAWTADQEPPALRAARQTYQNEIQMAMQPITLRYQATLERIKRDLGSKGDTVGMLAVQTEIDALRQNQPHVETVSAGLEGRKVAATVYITCDNQYTFWIGGQKIGQGTTWQHLDQYAVEIEEGDILAIECTDLDPGSHTAGLFCCIVLNDSAKAWGSDETWHCSTTKPPDGWQSKRDPFPENASRENVFAKFADNETAYRQTAHSARTQAVWSKKPNMATVYFREQIRLMNFRK